MKHDPRPIDDLIYTRLDLPQPPEVDAAALSAWAVEASRPIVEASLHKQHMNVDAYPWVSAYVVKNGEFDEKFVERFPEIVEYMKHFPTTRWKGVALLCQRHDNEVFLHTDPDFGIGWRVYLSHGGPRLYVQKFKQRYSERPQTWANGGAEGLAALCHPEKHYMQDSGRFAWALTAIRAAHGVERSDVPFGERITLVLVPELACVDQERNVEMLRRGAEKYADTAIWY